MNSKTYLDLAANKLSLELSAQYGKIFEKRYGDGDFSKPAIYDNAGQYVRTIFDLHLKILSTFETLCTIPIYLNNLPRKASMTKK